MRTFRLAAAVLLALLATAGTASASWYAHGNFWYYPGYSQAYVRYYQAPYYSGYSYTPGYYYYTPYYAPAQPAAPATPKLTVENPDWRAEVIKLKAKQDEQAAFDSTLRALGVQPGNNGYAGPSYNHNLGQLIVPQGSTSVGYGAKTVLEAYGDPTALTAAIQSHAQTVQMQQNAAKEASGQLGGLAKSMSDAQAKTMNDFLTLVGKAEMIRTAHGSGFRLESSSNSTSSNTQTGQAQPAVKPMPQAEEQPQARAVNAVAILRQQLVNKACVSCHDGSKKERLNLTNYDALNDEARALVWERLTTDDESIRMPRGTGGKAGPRVSGTNLKLFSN